jgi:acyl carrier protein
VTEPAEQIIAYIKTEVLADPLVAVAVDTPLVSSGMIDSFALVDILMEVERVLQRKIPASKVQPKDMDTVALMLQTAERLGKPGSLRSAQGRTP